MRLIKAKVERITGISFKIKDFRSTLTTNTINGDLSRLNAMSVQLRHESPNMTRRSYAAIDRSAAGRELKEAYKENQIITRKHPVFEKFEYMSGYG
jgi:integrase